MNRLWMRMKKWFPSAVAGTRVVDLSSSAALAGEDATTVAGLRVLLIDDNQETRELLSGTLKHYGAEVTAVVSAGVARELLERVQPQVVVSNCLMEPAEASALIRKVRAMEAERKRRIPTVTVSAYAEAKHVLNQLTGFQIRVPTLADPRELVCLIGRVAAESPSR